jgi:excisionase family DNA binding protein
MAESEQLTVKEVLDEWKISRRTLYNWIQEGLPVTRLSQRTLRIKRGDLERFLEERNRRVQQERLRKGE